MFAENPVARNLQAFCRLTDTFLASKTYILVIFVYIHPHVLHIFFAVKSLLIYEVN